MEIIFIIIAVLVAIYAVALLAAWLLSRLDTPGSAMPIWGIPLVLLLLPWEWLRAKIGR